MARGQLLVFMVSAFWHGFYVGYYISFFYWFNITNIVNSLYRISTNNPKIMEIYEKSGIVGHLLAWFLLNVSFSYTGTFFMLLSLPNCLHFMRTLYYLPAILMLVLNQVLQRMAPANSRHGKEVKEVK